MNDRKSIVIAVTGSIAAYKSCDLIRLLTARNIPVHVILTENAEKFVGVETFRALTGNLVHSGKWDAGMIHIELKKMARVLAVVPATANILGKFASGVADDPVSTTYLAAVCPVLVAPAMNPGMWKHPAVRRNLETLQQDGVTVVPPVEGNVICGDEGTGKLAPVEDIAEAILALYNS